MMMLMMIMIKMIRMMMMIMMVLMMTMMINLLVKYIICILLFYTPTQSILSKKRGRGGIFRWLLIEVYAPILYKLLAGRI